MFSLDKHLSKLPDKLQTKDSALLLLLVSLALITVHIITISYIY